MLRHKPVAGASGIRSFTVERLTGTRLAYTGQGDLATPQTTTHSVVPADGRDHRAAPPN